MGTLAAGDLLAGKYRLDRPLAQGGMGSVWVAFDTRLEVPVAIKLMAPALAGSPDLVARFEREAKAAAQLRSQHVVQVFEHGVEQGTPYMAMELLEGEDLGTRLKRLGRLSLWEAAMILDQVSKALRRAHEAGIVHRDLKPGNIFLARQDEDEVVKVLDFGIAKSGPPARQGEGTRTGVIMGSPSYMSPEQVRSTKAVDHRSDLWSLGLVMFRVVTGRPAFSGENDADVLVKLCADPVPVPSAVAPDLSAEVDAFFVRALCRDPEGRFQSAREMAAAFGRLVGRVPSVGEAAPTGAPAERTVELPAEVSGGDGDGEQTVPFAGTGAAVGAAGAAEKTVPLPVAAAGSTLTGAGNMSAAAPVASRAWLAWGLAGCVVVGAAAAFGLVAMRGAPRGGVRVEGSVAAAGTGSAAQVAPAASATASATAEASAPVVASATAEAAPATSASEGQTAPSGMATAVGSAPRPWPTGKAKSSKAATSTPAPGAGDGLGNIPRVLPAK